MKKLICLALSFAVLALSACGPEESRSESEQPEESVIIEESQESLETESAEESETPANIGIPFEQEGFTVTFHKIEREGSTVRIEMTVLRSETGDEMNLRAKDRFRLIAADKQITYLSEVYDMEGNSLLGTYIETDQPIHLIAVFVMEEGFEPVQFRFVYDIQGFRYIKIDL